MDLVKRQPVVALLAALLVGFFIGLVIFGWYLTPVEYTGAGPQDLLEEYQDIYIVSQAQLYALTNNQALAQQAFQGWEAAPAAICSRADSRRPQDPAEAQRLEALATVITAGETCATLGQVPEEEAGGIGALFTVLLLLIIFAGLLAALYFVWQRSGTAQEPAAAYPDVMDTRPPTTMEDSGDELVATPIARFQTTYARGHDTYDDSFSIENEQGDFLGECGVGISESIGMDEPKNVTAFEVWLFDKNDIRTVTKVIMSDHAFFDEALKAKLAPKGEPVLAREGETIVLETETLIVNAEITDMEYGSGALPPKSFFERFTVELSAWAKEGDFEEPDVQGHIDEMLDY